MDDSLARVLMLVHVMATLFMVGVIWFVQIIHYPLFAAIGKADFAAYEQAHTRRTVWVVAPPMLIELITGILLLFVRPAGVTLIHSILGVVLIAVVCFSTQFVQVPCHARLSLSFDPSVHRRLVSTNWVRTAAWSLRGLLVIWMVWMTFMEAPR